MTSHAGDRTRERESERVTVFEVSDLLFYLRHHSSVSGIQRVVAELLPVILRANLDCQLSAFDARRRCFAQVPRELMLELFDSLHALPDTESARGAIAELAGSISDHVSKQPPLKLGDGDVVAVLGAAWSFDGFFVELQSMKSRGVRLVILVYDLIPIASAGFPRTTADPFEEYLTYVANLADRAPCISHATSRSLVDFCQANRWKAPPGAVTGLPPGITPKSFPTSEINQDRAWPRPFVLFVGTVEGRKNHLLVLHAWLELNQRLGVESVPDLVCVGRIGWNVQDFLRELTESDSAAGRIHVLAHGVPDRELYRLYRDCEFTVYPSSQEGWGLPVSESIAFTKPVITSNGSSLPEAGGTSALYVNVDDATGLADTAQRLLTDPSFRRASLSQLDTSDALSWEAVADEIWNECAAAAKTAGTGPPILETDIEYGLGDLSAFAGTYDGGEYLDFVNSNRRLPLTGQVATPARKAVARLAAAGQPEGLGRAGLRYRAGSKITISFSRDTCESLALIIATRPTRGKFRVTARTHRGSKSITGRAGAPILIPLGAAPAGSISKIELKVNCGVGIRNSLTSASLLVKDEHAVKSGHDPSNLARVGEDSLGTLGEQSITYPRLAMKSFEASAGYKVARFTWRAKRKLLRVIQERGR